MEAQVRSNIYFPNFTSSMTNLSNKSSLKLIESSQNRPLSHRLSIENNTGYQLRNKINQKLENLQKSSKRKQLRVQSSKKLSLGMKVRSLSNFVNQYRNNQFKSSYQQNNNWRLQDRQMKGNSRLLLSQNLREYNQQYYSKQSYQNKNIDNALDWGKKRKKKTRKLTAVSDSQNTSNKSSNLDTSQTKNSESGYRIQFKKQRKNIHEHNKILSQFIEPAFSFPIIQKRAQQNTFRLLKKQDFQIGKKLGSGNFSDAYLVRHKKSGFICALKIMSKRKIIQEKYESQIARQIKIQSYLKHQNIVQLYGVFEDFQNIYLLIEFCPDGHLFGLIRKNTRIDEQATSKVVEGICHGIQYTHRQSVIHRDLKPENIFLCFGIPKIGDFGWAVYMDGTMRKTTSGSPLYYSPEIVKNEEYDEKIDIWGIGMITYQCLIGMAPFKIYSLINLNKIVNDLLSFPSYVQISSYATDFIQRCLTKNPQKRWNIQAALKHKFISYYK